MNKKVVVIGAGIGGLGTAALFAKKGYDVTVVEKNANFGGRANIFEADGFRFDMGPSWYLAPDIFEHFFELAGEKVSDHLKLERLSPSYRIFFRNSAESVDINSDITVEYFVERMSPKWRSALRGFANFCVILMMSVIVVEAPQIISRQVGAIEFIGFERYALSIPLIVSSALIISQLTLNTAMAMMKPHSSESKIELPKW